MDIKLKNNRQGWTSRAGVKITGFILTLALCSLIMNSLMVCFTRMSTTGSSPEIVLADLSTNQYFYDENMPNAVYHAQTVMLYKSEESIAAGEHLCWLVIMDDGSSAVVPDASLPTAAPETSATPTPSDFIWPDDDYEPYTYERDYELDENRSDSGTPVSTNSGHYTLQDTNNGNQYGAIPGGYFNEKSRVEMENYAKHRQLSDFLSSLDALSSSDAPYYLIYSGAVAGSPAGEAIFYSNVDEANQSIGFFTSQPVYYVRDNDARTENRFSSSIRNDYAYYSNYSYPFNYGNESKLYIAFPSASVNAFNASHEDVRAGYLRDISAIAVSALLIVVLVVILLYGAGRRYVPRNDAQSGDGAAGSGTAGGVRLLLIDRLYLDIGLVAVISWVVLTIVLVNDYVFSAYTHYSSNAVNFMLVAATTSITAPSLLWLLSFAKHVKIGNFWKHTLIYALPSWVIRSLSRFFGSLWAGLRLTAKVALIIAASFVTLIISGAVGYSTAYNTDGFPVFILAIIITIIISILLLRYARRLHALELGARSVSGGAYDVKINAGGGELGTIADSINNISAGINTAVELRMKSERLKTELITNVSHDIRTPLTSIITYTDLLKHEGLHCEKAPEYLEVLTQKSARLKTLTDELFEAAKAATGNIEVNITGLDIVSLINQVLGELDGAVKASGLDLRITLPERLEVRADGRLMWRVMENLLSNVFKYSLPGSRVYLDATDAAGAVRISLKNISATTLNIDPAELTERFKRGDESRADGGSGLGLSIVQSFVAAQGGSFDISIDGDLFKATVTLPGGIE